MTQSSIQNRRAFSTNPHESDAFESPVLKLMPIARRITSDWFQWSKEKNNFKKEELARTLIYDFGRLERGLNTISNNEEEYKMYSVQLGTQVHENAYRLGVLHAFKKDWTEAVPQLKRAAELEPDSYLYLTTYADALQNAEMYAHATEVYTNLLTSGKFNFKKPAEKPVVIPKDEAHNSPMYEVLNLPPRMKYPRSELAEIMFHRGFCFFRELKFDLALEDWKKIAAMEPNHRTADTWAHLAKIASMSSKWEKAMEYSGKALGYDPEHLFALYNRVTAGLVLGKKEETAIDSRKFSVLTHDARFKVSTHKLPDPIEEYDYEGDDDHNHHLSHDKPEL